MVMALIVTAAPSAVAIGQERNGTRHRVEIHQFKFVPESITVAAGDTVVWVNLDIVPHTFTATDSSWVSGNMEPDTTWEMAVTDPISGEYFCEYHPTMTASIDVSNALQPLARRE